MPFNVIPNTQTDNQDILMDYLTGTNPIYVGTAMPGTQTSAAAWSIKKITYDGNNNPTSVLFGKDPISNTYINACIWDNRASLNYS